MKKLNLFIVLILIFSVLSCDKETEQLPDNKNYIEITINGKTSTINSFGSGFKGFSGQKTCDGKPSVLDVIGTIKTDDFVFELSLFHYMNLSDFEDSKKGTFKVGSYILSEQDSSNCNLDALVYLEDKNENIIYTTLMPGGEHKVTGISILGQDNSSNPDAIKYEITGEINNIVFINAGDKEILVSGRYRAYVYIPN